MGRWVGSGERKVERERKAQEKVGRKKKGWESSWQRKGGMTPFCRSLGPSTQQHRWLQAVTHTSAGQDSD